MGEELATFSSLAAELRISIWTGTIREPQIVEVFCRNDGAVARSNVPAPVILYVCRESRQIAERHFRILNMHRHRISVSPIYIQLNLDTIYFSLSETVPLKSNHRYLSNILGQVEKSVARDLRKITVDLGACLEPENGRIGLQRFLPLDAFLAFRTLAKVDVVVGKKIGPKDMSESLELVPLRKYTQESDSDSDERDEDSYQCECCRREHCLYFNHRTRRVMQGYIKDLRWKDRSWRYPLVEGFALKRREEDEDELQR